MDIGFTKFFYPYVGEVNGIFEIESAKMLEDGRVERFAILKIATSSEELVRFEFDSVEGAKKWVRDLVAMPTNIAKIAKYIEAKHGE